jgi:hypothetical protein
VHGHEGDRRHVAKRQIHQVGILMFILQEGRRISLKLKFSPPSFRRSPFEIFYFYVEADAAW